MAGSYVSGQEAILARLLIVDDETALIRVLREAFELKLPQLEVFSASDWDGALAEANGLAETGGIQVLLTDQHLGERTGIDLCRVLSERFPGLRMLVYTGKAGPRVESSAREVGARVLWKPMRLAKLIAEVEAELQAR